MRVRVQPLLWSLSVLLGAAALAPAGALASSSDAAATQAYLQANATFVRDGRAHLSAAEHAPISKVLDLVQQECPLVGTNSPQDTDSEQLSNEVVGAIVLSAYGVDIPAGRAFVAAVGHLRWSNHALTSRVQAYAANIKTLYTLSKPSLCADIRAWGASSYATLPASTVQFDARFMPAWVAIGYLPSGLAAFESPGEKGLAHHTAQVEEELAEGEARVVETYREIMNALALNP